MPGLVEIWVHWSYIHMGINHPIHVQLKKVIIFIWAVTGIFFLMIVVANMVDKYDDGIIFWYSD